MAGQFINLIASPLLTRIFSPAEFGYFGVFSSLVSIVTGSTALKLERALPLKEDKSDYSDLFWVCLVINAVVSLFVALILSVVPLQIYEKLNIGAIHSMWGILGISLLLSGTNRIFNSAVVRFKAFKTIATSFLNQVIVKNVFQIGFGYFHPTSYVLILGSIVNQVTSSVNLVKVIAKNKMIERPKLTFSKVCSILRIHRDYVIYGTPSGLTNTLGLFLPVPLVMFYYGPEAAGALSFSLTLISIPMRVIGNSISQVFVGEASELIRSQRSGVRRLYNNISKKLALFIICPMILVLVFGRDIFGVAFGDNWTMAGEFSQILIICYAFQFVASPLSQILNLLVMQKVQLFWDLFRLTVTIISLSVPVHLGYGVNIAIICFTIGMCISYLALILICKYCIQKYENKICVTRKSTCS